MKEKKLFLILVICALVTGLLVGCTTESSEESELVHIEIHTSSEGTGFYAVGVGLSELLEKHHPWLRATARITGGPGENVETLIRDPDRRKNTLVALTSPEPWGAAIGKEPYFSQPFSGLKYVFMGSKSITGWVTIDPDITELEDLRGKTVGFYAPGSSVSLLLDSVFLGMDDEFRDATRIEYLSYDAATNAVADGLFDATVVSTTIMPEGQQWIPVAWGTELVMHPQARYIDVPEDVMSLGAERGGYPNSYVRVPAGAIKPGHPEFGAMALDIFFAAHADMPEEIVYEITKFVDEHSEELADYTVWADAWTPEYHAQYDQEMHPGAVRYYEEIGVL